MQLLYEYFVRQLWFPTLWHSCELRLNILNWIKICEFVLWTFVAVMFFVQSWDILFMFTFQDVHTVRLKLRKPESKKKVQWQSGTVDNENMNKKKSKCEHLLCIFILHYMRSGVCSVVKSIFLKMHVFWGVMLYYWVRVSDVSAGFSAFC